MIFQDILNEKHKSLQPDFDKLLGLCEQNQTHYGDLLLVHQNGFYHPEVHTWDNISEKLSPYVIGPGSEGHSEHTHHDFIGRYINQNIKTQSSMDYLESVKYDSNRISQIQELEKDEGYSIQQEMLIYLKIWESDAFIKSFYQLAKIANGEDYDWHFKIKENPSENDATGSRGEIIRNLIRDRFKTILPKLYNSFKIAYKSQVRNAIAHSQYCALGRYISLNNYDRNSKYNTIPSIAYDDWINMFHETIIIYSSYNRILIALSNHYHNIAAMNNNLFEIRINRIDPVKSTEYRQVQYDPIFKDWR
jgi:hypothetical protein